MLRELFGALVVLVVVAPTSAGADSSRRATHLPADAFPAEEARSSPEMACSSGAVATQHEASGGVKRHVEISGNAYAASATAHAVGGNASVEVSASRGDRFQVRACSKAVSRVSKDSQ